MLLISIITKKVQIKEFIFIFIFIPADVSEYNVGQLE